MSKRILIVDDDTHIRSLIREHLEQSGHEVFEAGNGVEACVWFDENRCDLTVLDVVMPEMDGIEFAYELKRRFPDMPILAISAGEHIMSKELCLGMMECLGAVDVMPKPFEIHRFMGLLNSLLAKTDSPASPN